jgi:flagellar assembly factor FliW
VLAIVTLPRDPGAAATLNLQGPLLLSFSDGTGRQLVLPRSAWGIRHPIDLSAGAPRGD